MPIIQGKNSSFSNYPQVKGINNEGEGDHRFPIIPTHAASINNINILLKLSKVRISPFAAVQGKKTYLRRNFQLPRERVAISTG